MDLLIEIENYLFSINKDSMMISDNTFAIKADKIKDKAALELYLKLHELIETMLKES